MCVAEATKNAHIRIFNLKNALDTLYIVRDHFITQIIKVLCDLMGGVLLPDLE